MQPLAYEKLSTWSDTKHVFSHHECENKSSKCCDKYQLFFILFALCHVVFTVCMIFAFSSTTDRDVNYVAIYFLPLFLIILLLTCVLPLTSKWIKTTVAIWCLVSSAIAICSVILAANNIVTICLEFYGDDAGVQFNEMPIDARWFMLANLVEILFDGSHIALCCWLYCCLTSAASDEQAEEDTDILKDRIPDMIKEINSYKNTFGKSSEYYEFISIIT